MGGMRKSTPAPSRELGFGWKGSIPAIGGSELREETRDEGRERVAVW